tara:strand:+ start:137 stop:625 length:489 start_codon:yes stop_codon:yes gene_type:complete
MKYITYIFITGLMLLLVGCVFNSEKTFKNMWSVIQALEKHKVTNCEEVRTPVYNEARDGKGVLLIDVATNGAVDAQVCKVTSSGSAVTWVEFWFWEEDNAKNACTDDMFGKCVEEEVDGFLGSRFYGNLHVTVYYEGLLLDPVHTGEKNSITIDSFISDLKD